MQLLTPGGLRRAFFLGGHDHGAATRGATHLVSWHEWATARIKGDVAFLESLYAKEFRITAMNGSVVERDADIGAFASGAIKPESITDEDMNVSVYGDAAVVTGIENVRGTYKGVFGELALRFTNVFARRDGRWQLVTHQSTEVRNKGAGAARP